MALVSDSVFKEGYPIELAPYFDGSQYEFWRRKIYFYISSIDSYLWDVVENGFVLKPKCDWDEHDRKKFSLNIKAMHILHHALHENVYA